MSRLIKVQMHLFAVGKIHSSVAVTFQHPRKTNAIQFIQRYEFHRGPIHQGAF